MNPFLPSARVGLALAALLLPLAASPVRADAPAADSSSSIEFSPPPWDERAMTSTGSQFVDAEWEGRGGHAWYSDDLLGGIESWHRAEGRHEDVDLIADYNRVDPLRLGLGWRFHSAEPFTPRLAARLERAFGRERTLYSVQFEQPMLRNRRISLGAYLSRRTDHNDLQQSGDAENSLAMLFGHFDGRDYFEREGAGVYAALHVPHFSEITAHWRTEQYRSLLARSDARAWVHNHNPLRPNPAIDDGEMHSVVLRLESSAGRTRHVRAGLFHRLEWERAGHGAGGAFEYTRVLGDVRSVVQLSPATTLSLRAAAGHTPDGTLPRQREFTLGGADVLRAHAVDAWRGDRMALAQAEYDVALWRLSNENFASGLHALAFVEAGTAWNGSGARYDLDRQKPGLDGGIGLGTSGDALCVTLAKDLRDLNHDFVIGVRLQRPF